MRTILTILTGSIAALTSMYAYIMSDSKIMVDTGDVLKMLDISENDKRFQSLTEILLKTTSYTSDDIENLYKDFEKIVEDLNDFFSERLISDKYNFKIDFTPNETFKIDWMKNLQSFFRGHQHSLNDQIDINHFVTDNPA